jgi:WD40 repeat protein
MVWDGTTGKVRQEIDDSGTSLALSPDRTLLACGHDDGRITVWALATGNQVATFRSSRTTVNCLAFGRDPVSAPADPDPPLGRGWLLAAGPQGGDVVAWDVGSRIPRTSLYGSYYDVYVVAFSPDGATLASTGRVKINLWDLQTGRLLLTMSGERFNNAKFGLAFSPDGQTLVVSGEEQGLEAGDVIVFDLDNGRGIQTLRGLRGMVEKVRISADGRLVAALAQNWQVAIWDRAAGRLRHILDVPFGFITDNSGLAFSPDGRRFAFASGREATLWDLDTGRRLRSWILPPALQDTLAFRGPDQLLLCRFETKNQREGPFGRVDLVANPGVVRMRDLLSQDSTRPVWENFDFNWANRVAVFEGTMGKPAWPMLTEPSSHPGSHSDLRFDPTGTIMSLKVPQGGPWSLLEIATGRFRGALDPSGTPGPDARRWLWRSLDDLIYNLQSRERQDSLVVIPIDPQSRPFPCFSSDGRYGLWSNSDGTVTVCDFLAIQPRLTELGLGWE